MPDLSHVLRETSDELLNDLQTLETLEGEKRAMTPGDPRVVDMAARIEEIAGRVLSTTTRQRVLTEEIQTQAETRPTGAMTVSIEDTPRPIATILAEWRDAERRLAAAEPGTAEAREASLLCDELREEYRAAHEEARRSGRR